MAKWKNGFDWDKLKKEMVEEQSKKTKNYQDDRFWSPDWKRAIKEQKMYLFRFIPDTDGQPFVKYYNHGFQYNKDGQRKWYINNCMTTFGWDPGCPICSKNSEYWDSPYESDKEIAKQRKRRLNYVSNIYMIDDPFNPDNNGKVFLYRYGQSIYGKIEKLLFPSETDLADPDFEQFVPFDLYEGANSKLKITKQGDFPNYDNSDFSRPKPLGKEDEIDEVMKQTHQLSEFVDISKYPTPEKVIEQVGFLLGEEVEDQSEPEKKPDSKKKAKKEEPEPEKEDNPFLNDEDDNKSSESEEESTEDNSSDADNSGEDIDEDEEFFKNL